MLTNGKHVLDVRCVFVGKNKKKTASIRSNIIQEMNEIRDGIGICVSYSIANQSQI